MDMDFPHRGNVAVDLAILLARSSALQAATPTAIAQTRLDMPTSTCASGHDHVALFADSEETVAAASFAPIFNVRQ